MVKILTFLSAIILSTNSFAQTYWRIENERGEELLLTINIHDKNQTFETYTRKDALKEMAGSFMYMMAKTAGKIRFPELMHGEGKISFDRDTTRYIGIIDYPDKQFSLNAKIWKNNFYGLLTDNKNRTTVLTGEKVSSDKPLRDYPSLINRAFSLVEKYYWDAKLSKSSEWQNYKNDVDNLKMKIADDYELAMTTMWLGKKLVQVPHEIKKINKTDNNLTRKNIGLARVSGNKALIFLNNIQAGKSDIDQLFKEMTDKHFDTLIFEASGSKNLSLTSALLLVNHLTSHESNWGVFLTRKWSEAGLNIPLPSMYETTLKDPLALPMQPNSDYSEKGFYLKTIPALPLFKGKVYMLVNKGTSNVAEALAIYLKNEKIATIVGQKTAGSPTLTEVLEIDKQYRITIPFAQFYDKNGKSYQGIGVIPDLTTELDPLGYVLKL